MPESTPVRSLGAVNERGCRVLSDAGFSYADGAEGSLFAIVGSASDISASSQELADAASDWATTYSLTPTRSNIVRALDLRPEMRVLEIGCGCGPITRYLGEQCATVDALEPMEARAAVARLRTRDLESVEVLVGTLDDIPAEPTYDVVVVIGVLEYVGQGSAQPEPYTRFLDRCHSVLRDGGTLVLAIENPLGVKYIAGAVEDHTNRPFDSLEGYALISPARTFTRRALDSMLTGAGFESTFLAAFPDYKLPRALMTDELFRRSDQLAANLPRFPSPDYLVPRLNLADEAMTWHTLVSAGVAEHFANSLVALASKGGRQSLWPDGRLGLLFNSDRRPEFAVRGEVRDSGGSLVLERTALHPELARKRVADDVMHQPTPSERVVRGREILDIFVAEPEKRAELLGRWAALVPDGLEWVPVDLVPHNIVVTDSGGLVVIDQEWFVRGYDRTSVLVRGLVLSTLRLAALARPERLAPWTTVIDAVRGMADEIGLDLSPTVLERYIELEARFQGAVNATDRDIEVRRKRSADGLRSILGLTLSDVRGGERFDFQWARAAAQLESHERDVDALKEELAEMCGQLDDVRTRLMSTEGDLRAARDALYRRTPRGMAGLVVARLRRLRRRP